MGNRIHAVALSHGQILGITFAADKGFQAGLNRQVLPKGARPGGLAGWDRKHGRRQARKVSGLFGQGIGRALFSPFGNDAASVSGKNVMLRALLGPKRKKALLGGTLTLRNPYSKPISGHLI